jgi:hypothetical protein
MARESVGCFAFVREYQATDLGLQAALALTLREQRITGFSPHHRCGNFDKLRIARSFLCRRFTISASVMGDAQTGRVSAKYAIGIRKCHGPDLNDGNSGQFDAYERGEKRETGRCG